jgi:anti-sigma factor RsiW
MKPCEHIRAHLALYLDDELSGHEQAAFESHFQNCESCSQALADIERLLEWIREASPFERASPALRARVERIVQGSQSGPQTPRGLLDRVRPIFWSLASRVRISDGRIAAITLLLILAIAAGVWYSTRRYEVVLREPLSEFSLMAVDTHMRYLRKQLPLEIVSAAPEEISAWFVGKLPFRLKLPNYQEVSGQEKLYQLEGGRLVGYNNDYAAYVAYNMRQRPISLVVTSSTVAQPSGGEEIASKGLKFHFMAVNGFKVITWSDRGLTYALVSDLEERGQQSCIVCHAGAQDQEFIDSLKPAR